MAAITIPLYYDLDLLLWTSAAGGIARQPNLVLGQSDSIAFAVQFVRSGVVIELTSPAWICGIKPINDTAGDYLCQTTTGVKTGSGASTVYTFTLLLDSTELRAWLLTVTAVSNYAAFSIRDTVNLIATLPAITCTILPDYTLEGTTPTAASGTLIVASGQTFTVNKSFAMPTDDGQNTYVLKTNGAGVGSWVADNAGTGTVTSVSVTTANGVSGSVATSTTTPAITLTLGAITPTTGAFSSTTESNSHLTGAVTIAGGLGVSKNLYVNGNASFSEDAVFSSDIICGGVFQGRYFNSTNNLPALYLPPIDGSVNYVAVEPSLTTLPVHIYAQGTDANIGLHLSPKGTGFVNIEDGTDTTKRLRFSASGNSTGITTTLASLSTTSQTITLPNATAATTLAGLQMTQTFTQVNTFSSSTASTSTTSGAVVITGGLGVGGNAYVGGAINIAATTSTAGQITQGGERFIHTFTQSGQNQNVFIGFQAGRTSVMSGGGNIGIGRACLQGLTNGANNLCFGDGVAYGMTTGSSNVIIGQASGNTLTTGNNNAAVGVNSLKSGNTTACVASGYNALRDALSNSHVAVGFNAGYSITGTAGASGYNTCIGDSSGTATSLVGGLTGIAITTGTNNTMLGAKTSATSASGTYRTAVGSDSICQSDNSIKLGRDTLDKVIIPSWAAAPTTSLSAGMLYYDTVLAKLRVYTTAWETITSV